MPLTLCSDVSPARWITDSDIPWQRLVTFGPAGFAAYGRLRLLPDPAYPGQSENDVEPAGLSDAERLRGLCEVLAGFTTTPQDCYFCLWEGCGAFGGTTVSIGRPMPAVYRGGAEAEPPLPDVPRVMVPHRAYFLFRGPLSEIGEWDFSSLVPGASVRPAVHDTAFFWPADHAWCVANDVDPHFAGIGAGADVLGRLVADRRLDVVPADPRERQPLYY